MDHNKFDSKNFSNVRHLILRAYLDVKLAAVSCSLLNIEAAAAIEAIDGAVAMELASVLASIVSSVLMLCLAVSML